MLTLLLSLLAGALTTLSPCVLPILPIVLFGALDQHRFGPLALRSRRRLRILAVRRPFSSPGVRSVWR